MAGKGTYTALQRLKPINVDWGDVAKTGVEREDVLYERKQAEAKARKEARDKIGYSELKPIITGIDSLDKGIALGLQEAQNMKYDDYKRARQDPAYADSTEYKIRTKNLDNYSKNLKLFSDGFAKLAKKVIEKSNNDTLSAWDSELLQIMNGGFVSEKVKFGVNPDGSIKALLALTDRNLITDENPEGYVYDEDGEIQMKEVTPNEIFKGLGSFSITADVDVDTLAKDMGKELGKDETAKVSGLTTTTIQDWDTKKESVRESIKGSLGTAKNPTALAKRLWADHMGQSSRKLTDSDMKLIEDEYLKKIGTYYDQFNKEKKDHSTGFKYSQAKKKELKERIEPSLIVDETTGEPVKTSFKGSDGKDSKEGYGISFGEDTALQVEKSNSSTTFITNLYFSENGIYADKIEGLKKVGEPIRNDDGSINWMESLNQGKGWVKNEKKKVKLTRAEATNAIKHKSVVKKDGTPFEDLKDFTDYYKVKFEEKTSKSSEQDEVQTVTSESGYTYG